jgi:hypothetical protein
VFLLPLQMLFILNFLVCLLEHARKVECLAVKTFFDSQLREERDMCCNACSIEFVKVFFLSAAAYFLSATFWTIST